MSEHTISADEVFAQSLKKRKEEKEKQESYKQNAGGSYEDITYSALAINEYKQLRVLGFPANNRMDDPYSVKSIFYSMIEGDDGKRFRVIWPDKSEKDWILWQILRKVMAYKWNPEEKKREYYHQDTQHRSVFNMVSCNGNTSNPYETGWQPSQVTLMNVIDRSVMDMHREAKHTFLLSKKSSSLPNGGTWYDAGIPTVVYEELYDKIAAAYGPWSYYDVVIIKNDKQPYYNVYHAGDSKRQLLGLGFTVNEEFSERPLTEEELSWDKYDLDKLFPITSYNKLLNRLGNKITLIDKSFGTEYHKLLTSLVQEEKEKQESAKKETPTVSTSVPSTPSTPSTPEPVKTGPSVDAPKPRPRPPVASASESSTGFDVTAVAQKYGLKGVALLNDTERSFIVGYDEEKGTFLYRDPSDPEQKVELYACVDDDCPMQSPDFFRFCPRCAKPLSSVESEENIPY